MIFLLSLYNGFYELLLFSVKNIFYLSGILQYMEASRSYSLLKEAAVSLPALAEPRLSFILQIKKKVK